MLWRPNSWKNYIVSYMHLYKEDDINKIKNHLSMKGNIVSIESIDNLKSTLKNLKKNNQFIVHMGECAETFTQSNFQDVNSRINLINEFSSILNRQGIISIGRIAGQYAKPRSSDREKVNDVELLTYKGDILHSFNTNKNSRKIDSKRLLLAYEHSKETMVHIKKIKPELFISHEALFLDYEESLTRQINDKYYNISTHMPWLGDRTRFLESAHIEYLRGISNPIAIKLGSNIALKDFFQIITRLNPNNEEGKIVILSRMGANKIDLLKDFIKEKKRLGVNLLWVIDPMHGNTLKLENGFKTRKLNDIVNEIEAFKDILKEEDEYFAGIHLETTPLDVTECIDDTITEKDLAKNYLTYCDPRLNKDQTLKIAKIISKLI